MKLKDLAHKLGMSRTTVSRALNGHPEVSERTRERVIAVAASVGYRPNTIARHLATGRADAIGIICPLTAHDLGDPYFLEVVSGMTKAIERTDKDLIIASSSNVDELRTYERMTEGRRVDGMIVTRTKLNDPRLQYLVKKCIPFVAYGRSILPGPYSWFDFDTEAGVRQAVERLVNLGHRRIALLNGPLELHLTTQARKGYIDAMAAAGLPVDARYMIEGTLSRAGSYEAMTCILSCNPRPTAVIVDNPPYGAGAVRALVDAGVTIGSAMSIIVNGGLPPDTLMGYNFTTLQSAAPHDVGVTIIELMLAVLNGEPPEKLHVLWQPSLEIGNSDGPCID
ncbi:Transcriptional regulator, LacI family [Paraburkholderia piptadeniae]|uniref:LacI family DNA-binding transcriptional regulator n=2 Tax=Paraburkholderia TaxID=1822464 RepID=A0A7X1TGW4_9BURK|nr:MULTISPECIES: substrate-binding domain-containing protein [Paraburkholderia]MPW18793.1 LacI family DNA-binding transcriptional regulator [Paraburkholderia franconis]SIT51925.1 Transcriptional regulator, LacI family [Paraburkholderia piptadeniae]